MEVSMTPNPIVSPQEWLTARRALLEKEKELTQLRDRISAERQTLPWIKVDKQYVFDGLRARLPSQISSTAAVSSSSSTS
jgi:predicted dithiol-disulfide oxidoreductase (DUF899 family)